METTPNFDSLSIGVIVFVAIFYLFLLIFPIICYWKIFNKAGKPGWACIVPIYNLVVMIEIAKKPMWYIAMFFIPIANIVFAIMLLDAFVKQFGKSSGFTVGMIFLNIIFLPILAFGDARYQGAENEDLAGEALDFQA